MSDEIRKYGLNPDCERCRRIAERIVRRTPEYQNLPNIWQWAELKDTEQT